MGNNESTGADNVNGDPSVSVNAPPSQLPKMMVAPDHVHSFLLGHHKAFLELPSAELVHQLALFDQSMFKSIGAKELLDQSWEKKDRLERSPNVAKMIQRTNNVSGVDCVLNERQLTMWIVNCIVKCEVLVERVQVIRYFVMLGMVCANGGGVLILQHSLPSVQQCREINNFNALTAIIAALTNGPVRRMVQTWEVRAFPSNLCLNQAFRIQVQQTARGPQFDV